MLGSTTLSLALVSWLAGVTPAHELDLAGYHLTLELPALEAAQESHPTEGQLRGYWSGKLGGSDVRILLQYLEERFVEPGDVTELVVDFLRTEEGGFDPTEQAFPHGAFGHASFASLVRGDIREEHRTDAAGVRMLLGGVFREGGWVVDVECKPAPSAADEALLRAFLEQGVQVTGPERDVEWTNEELLERWKRDAPEDLHGDFDKNLARPGTVKKSVIRTKNYVILTNASGGKKFAQEMEKNYSIIRGMFPFEDVEGRRLMPVFLFRDAEGYYGFYMRVAGVTHEEAKRSKGHAWRDYYATWYESPKDPVHIHEATHQVFANRLRLGGGGSWYQEGVAEYVESSENERNVVANLVKKGRHLALREFFALPSLLYSSEEDRKSGGSAAGDLYKQAALLMEFLRESKFGKARFPEFLQAVGKARRGDVERIEELTRFYYDVTIDELDQAFQEYCKKR